MKSLAFGETLWDIFSDSAQIGGTAFNAAAHLAKLGASSTLVSAVGCDKLGFEALDVAKGFGISCDMIELKKDLPTGTVEVSLDCGQPSYEIKENVAWDAIGISSEAFARIAANPPDCFIFGTLSQRSAFNRETLSKILDALPPGVRRAYDINLRQRFHQPEWIERSLQRATIVKVNEDEAKHLSRAIFGSELKPEPFAARLMKRHSQLEAVIITLGAEGSCALCPEGWIEVPGVKVEVVDAVGAGDSFIAATLFALSKGHGFKEALSLASRLGAFVASRRGAVPEYSSEISALFAKL